MIKWMKGNMNNNKYKEIEEQNNNMLRWMEKQF